MKKAIRIFDASLLCVVSLLLGLVSFGSYELPNNIYVGSAEQAEYYGSIYSVDSIADSAASAGSDSTVNSKNKEIKLLGAIPVKDVKVSTAANDKVVVGGEAFGIKIYTDGVMVVGTKNIKTNSKEVNPASEAGLEAGDIIVCINGKNIYSSAQFEERLVADNGKKLSIKVRRDDKYKTFELTPVYSQDDGCYKVGIWVRDSTAGIGTITFYNPENRTIAGLGHPITDVDTGEIMPILKGEAVKARVSKIIKSKKGFAGSVCCDFLPNTIGTLSENTDYGIYGAYSCKIDMSKAYQVASSRQVQRGDCQILTTVTEDGPHLYSAKITHISYRGEDQQKNMIIRITDEKLISITGGIVQGMSGSPIIQNGKIVGALTHVIVDNPKKGYAIFAESMLNQTKNLE